MSNATKDQLLLPPQRHQRQLVMKLAIVAGLSISAAIIYTNARSHNAQPSAASTPASSPPSLTAVTSLGYLEPKGEVVHLSTPISIQSGGARVDSLLVRQGERVRAGQVVALLNNYGTELAALKQAQAQVLVTQAKLAQVKAGAKIGDVRAQKATIARLAAQLNIDQREERRYQYLYQTGVISAELLDDKRLAVATDLEQINQAKSTLNSIAEVRPTDVAESQAEVVNAIAAVNKAHADLELTKVRAPEDSQVLKINTWPGEIVSDKGIVDLGRTSHMEAVAEVYETDIGRVHLGQRATITSKNGGFPGQLHGIVYEIDGEVGKKDVLDTDPAADIDSRVVEVKIRLEPADSLKVTSLSNSKLQIEINP